MAVERVSGVTATGAFLALCAALVLGAAGCRGAPQTSPVTSSAATDPLDRIASIHGGAGPWAVAGYRMGRYALDKLGLPAQSFDLEVVHHTPAEVQFSCIADGAAAATGASLGKLNLRLEDATEANVATTYRRKSTGRSLVLRPTPSFAARFRDVPRDQLAEAGRTVLALPDEAIFEEIPSPSH